MKSPTFNNRENKKHELENGRIIWESRAVATAATIVVRLPDADYVVLGCRGPAAQNFIGSYCLVCGYLDWDETPLQCIFREASEEVGIDLSAHNWRFTPDPWHIDTPLYGLQNVTMQYAFELKAETLPQIMNKKIDLDEVSHIIWVKLNDVHKFDLAFNHNEILKLYEDKIGEMRSSSVFIENKCDKI